MENAPEVGGVPLQRLDSVVGVDMEFLVPGNAGGFLMGKRAQRMRAMGNQHSVGIQITRQSDKHLRSLRLYATSPQCIVNYWEDLFSKASLSPELRFPDMPAAQLLDVPPLPTSPGS